MRGDGAHGGDEIVAAAVTEREREHHAAAVGGGFERQLDFASRRRRKLVEIADHLHADAALDELVAMLLAEFTAQAHQHVDLVLGTIPVRVAEGVEREVHDAALVARAEGAYGCLHALAMTGGSRQTA